MKQQIQLRNTLTLACLLAMASLLVSSRAAVAGCAHCGNPHGCQKICRLVTEEKKISITCWGYTCEEVCLPGPSCLKCEHNECVCERCEQPEDDKKKETYFSKPKVWTWTEWCPSTAQVYTKKKLGKKTVTKKVPSYKWVVEDLCPACEAKVPDGEPPKTKSDEIPKPPVANAKLKYETTR